MSQNDAMHAASDVALAIRLLRRATALSPSDVPDAIARARELLSLDGESLNEAETELINRLLMPSVAPGPGASTYAEHPYPERAPR